jgi:hypothetical protein
MSGSAQLFPVVGSTLNIPNPLPTNVTEWDSTTLTAPPTNWGTAPSGTVIGGNVELFAKNSALYADNYGLLVSIAAGTVIANISGPLTVSGTLSSNTAAPIADNVGVLPAVANQVAPVNKEGDQVLLSTDLSGALRTVLAPTSIMGDLISLPRRNQFDINFSGADAINAALITNTSTGGGAVS